MIKKTRKASVLSQFNICYFSASRSARLRNRFPKKILKIECSVEGQSLN